MKKWCFIFARVAPAVEFRLGNSEIQGKVVQQVGLSGI